MENNGKNMGRLFSDIYLSTKQTLKEIFYNMLYFPAGINYSNKKTIDQKLK